MKLSPILVSILLIIAQVCYCETDKNAIPIDPELTAQIDNFITNIYLPNAGISGLGISILKITDDGQEALYSNGYGMADQEKGIPNSNQTQFLIGSITKSLTSTVVVKILSENFPELGEAVMDTPIRTLVPSANFTLIDRFRSEHGTFRDLLGHRMCFQSDDLQLATDPFNTTSELTYRQRYAEEICGIRTEFQYNNEMFVMAGELIGIIAERSFETLVEELLTQIGMLDSTLSKKSDDYSDLPSRARPHYVMDSVSHPMNTDLIGRILNYNAAGGLWSTPDDMAKYLSFHLNLGKVGENQIIPESVMKWLTTPSTVIPFNVYKSSEEDKIVNLLSYGLGLMRASYDGWEYVQHSGYFNAFSSFFSLFPSQKIGIFTTSNQSPDFVGQQYLHAIIFEIFRGSSHALEKSTKFIEREKVKRDEQKRKQATIVKTFLGQVGTSRREGVSNLPNVTTGQYGSGSSGDIEIFEKFNPEINDTGLYMSYGKWGQGWLESYNISTNPIEVLNLRITWDTDIIQENYAAGDSEGYNYARVYNDTFEFLGPGVDGMISYGKFRLGVNLENLPPIPWNPDSC